MLCQAGVQSTAPSSVALVKNWPRPCAAAARGPSPSALHHRRVPAVSPQAVAAPGPVSSQSQQGSAVHGAMHPSPLAPCRPVLEKADHLPARRQSNRVSVLQACPKTSPGGAGQPWPPQLCCPWPRRGPRLHCTPAQDQSAKQPGCQ